MGRRCFSPASWAGDGYGVFATVWVWIAVLGHGSLGGFGISVCRFLPQHRVRGELDLARGFLAAGAVVGLASGAVVAAIGAALLWLARDLVCAEYLLPLTLALCVVPAFALQDYVEGVARSFNWTALAIAPPFIIRQGLIAVAMLLAVVWGAPPEPWVRSAAHCLQRSPPSPSRPASSCEGCAPRFRPAPEPTA